MGTVRPQYVAPLWLLAAGLSAASFISSRASAVLQVIHFHDGFETGNLDAWQMPYPEDWEIRAQPGNHFLHMRRSREPGGPRRPLQFALLKEGKVGSFEFQTRVRREGSSMIVVFNYVDTMHFYYVHLSADRGVEQPVHNGIFVVNGAPRKRIAGVEAPPALPDREWHHVRIVRDARPGSINVFVDHQSQPLFSVEDSTFICGQIGIGSFDETGDFDDIDLKSDDGACKPGSFLPPAASVGPKEKGLVAEATPPRRWPIRPGRRDVCGGPSKPLPTVVP